MAAGAAGNRLDVDERARVALDDPACRELVRGEKPWSTIYGLPLRLADDARRFDVSPTWFSALGSGLTLPWLASLDRAEVEAHALGLASRLRTELQLPHEPSAIVSIPTTSAEKLRDAGIRASIRAGAVRVGFHLYNTEDDLDRLLDVLR